jgi:Flp pilus assembly pilin Flp
MRTFFTSLFLRFQRDTSGAVSAEWVVLTAAVVGLAVGVISIISNGNDGAARVTSDNLVQAVSDAAG